MGKLIGDIVPIKVGVITLLHSVIKSSISWASSFPNTSGSVAFSSPKATLLSATDMVVELTFSTTLSAVCLTSDLSTVWETVSASMKTEASLS